MGLTSAFMGSPSYTRTEEMRVRVNPLDEAGKVMPRPIRDRYRITVTAALDGVALKVLGVPKQGSDGYPYVKGLAGKVGVITWTIKVTDPRTKRTVTVSKSWRFPWPEEGASAQDMGVVENPVETCATPPADGGLT